VLVLDMIEILPHFGKYKYDTWRILPVKCYINNSVRLRSCNRNVKRDLPSHKASKGEVEEIVPFLKSRHDLTDGFHGRLQDHRGKLRKHADYTS
jgi:hypothetical protein